MIIFGENDRKHRFWHFTTFSWACPRRARFFPQKQPVPNNKAYCPLLSCKNSEGSYDQFFRKQPKTSFFSILRNFHGHAEVVSDFSGINHLRQIIKSISLNHYAKNKNKPIIILGENDQKHRFRHFTTFSQACPRRVRFFPHKPPMPNH